MLKILVSILLLLPALSYANHNQDVKEEMVQLNIQESQCHQGHNDTPAEITACQQTYYDALDLILNREYQLIMSGRVEQSIKDKFRQSQRDWITFRDSNCAWQESLVTGDSGEEFLGLGCLTGMLDKRIFEILNQFYPQN